MTDRAEALRRLNDEHAAWSATHHAVATPDRGPKSDASVWNVDASDTPVDDFVAAASAIMADLDPTAPLTSTTRTPSVADTFTAYGGDAAGFVPCVHCGLKLAGTVDPASNPAGLERLVVTPAGPSCRTCAAVAAGTTTLDTNPRTLGIRPGTPVTARVFGADGNRSGVTRFDLPASLDVAGHLAITRVADLGYWSLVVNGQTVEPGSVRPAT